MASTAARPFQVVVWGASGFTGRLVCEHIARDYQGRIRWAMAGRDEQKLKKIRDELAAINPDVKDVPILIADSNNSKAVGDVLGQTQVVLALAGPFAKYGNNVVAQAVEQGTHYCDITGEVPWVKQNILKYNKAAEDKAVKIVHCCGYDSVPSDLGTLFIVDWIAKELKKKVAQVFTVVGDAKGGFSGGTVASGMNIVATTPMSELSQVNSNAYYLAQAAVPSSGGSDKPPGVSARYLPDVGAWAGPFIMEGCNARVVQLSNALRPAGPYGKDFKYTEMMSTGQGWSGWLGAQVMSFGISLIGIGFALGPTRNLLKKVLPAPGEGPSVEKQRSGYWNHKVVAVTEEEGGKKPTVVKASVGDKRDPGYWSTSRMILETGLSLVLDADAIAKSGACKPGGVMTPATAAGVVLVDRLQKAGFTFKIEETIKP